MLSFSLIGCAELGDQLVSDHPKTRDTALKKLDVIDNPAKAKFIFALLRRLNKRNSFAGISAGTICILRYLAAPFQFYPESFES
jgi:hypothetical protein